STRVADRGSRHRHVTPPHGGAPSRVAPWSRMQRRASHPGRLGHVPGAPPSDDHPCSLTGDDVLERSVADLLDAAGIEPNRRSYAGTAGSGLRVGREALDRGDGKSVATTLKELSYAFAVLAEHRGVPKAAMFGSARTTPAEPAYQAGAELGAGLARHGWTVI